MTDIIPYAPDFRDEVLAMVIEIWQSVMPQTQREVPDFVWRAFYPRGWHERQQADVGALLDQETGRAWLALQGGDVAGVVILRLHPDDDMGEIALLAVRPAYQRQGIGHALMNFAEDEIRAAGLKMAMVETIGDAGHAPARRAYEVGGYQPWPVARYFKPLK